MRELLQQALDVIKDATQQIEAEWIHDYEAGREAIAKLEAELAKPEQAQTDSFKAMSNAVDYLYSIGGEANTVANAAYLELKQLQLNLRDQTALHLLYKGDYEDLLIKTEQKPVAWDGWILREVYFEDESPCGHREPPKREWQGLTDEEIKNVWQEIKDAVCLDHQTFARAIEAKLREKNT